MKKLVMMAVALMAVATTLRAEDAAPAAVAEEAGCPISFDATLDFYSAYVWRGNVINDRPVWQPGGTVSYSAGDYGTFSVNVWANFDATTRNGNRSAGGLNEIDYTASYSVDVGPCSLEVGNIWYTFPKANGQDGKSTEEVYGGISYNNDYVTPFVKLYGDYKEADSLYGMVGLTKSVALTDRLSLDGTASVGAANDHYMEFYFADGVNGGFLDGNLSASLSYAVTDNISVGATLAWMSVLNSDARDAINDGSNDLYHGKTDSLWGGLNLAASF